MIKEYVDFKISSVDYNEIIDNLTNRISTNVLADLNKNLEKIEMLQVEIKEDVKDEFIENFKIISDYLFHIQTLQDLATNKILIEQSETIQDKISSEVMHLYELLDTKFQT